jgi:hypothetical protein
MPKPSPQLRFLLRGSVFFFAMLAVWWWLLLGPMLAGLRFTTAVALWLLPGGGTASAAAIEPSGDWLLRVPLPGFLAKQDKVQRAYGRKPGGPPVTVRAFRLDVGERVPKFFTLGFPLFWALVLAAPRSRRFWRVLAIGTALLALLTQLSLLLYVAYAIETTLRLAPPGLTAGLWRAAEYLNVNVAPYLAPLLLAAWLHTELRAQIFSFGADAMPAPAPAVEEKARRPRVRK